MGHQGHSYVLGVRERSYRSHRDSTGTTFVFSLACSTCPEKGERQLRTLMPPEQIDRKFIQVGWAVDPHICPACAARVAQEKAAMASKPSPAAIKAQAKMYSLIATHFDPERGCYSTGWSDAKISTEAGVSVDLVAEVRKETFGDLKVPPELAAITADINAFEQLAKEQFGSLQTELTALRARHADLVKRWPL